MPNIRRISNKVHKSFKLQSKTVLQFARAQSVSKLFQVKDYYKGKLEQPKEFVCNLASSYEDILSRTDLGFLLPHEDSHGRPVVYLRFGNIDTEREDWYVCLQSAILVLEWLSWKKQVQERGISAILDCTNLSYKIMRWATPHKLKTIVKMLQDSVPIKFEVIHIVNAPKVFNLFFAALKPFLRDHFIEKFQWHKQPYETLCSHLNDESLPQWLNGSLEIENIKYWYKDIFKDEDMIKEDPSMGYKK